MHNSWVGFECIRRWNWYRICYRNLKIWIRSYQCGISVFFWMITTFSITTWIVHFKRGSLTAPLQPATFGSISWDLNFKGSYSPVKVMIAYRPPYSKRKRSTPRIFLDEFAECLIHFCLPHLSILPNSRWLLLLGYINTSEKSLVLKIFHNLPFWANSNKRSYLIWWLPKTTDELLKYLVLLTKHSAIYFSINPSKPQSEKGQLFNGT